MKKNFLKVFSLLLVLSMLAISVSAVVTDKPQSEITITAEPGTVVLCKSATVTVTLTMPTCYAIEGQWTATSGLTLTSLTRDGGATLSHTNGVVEWADVEGTDETKWFTNPMKTMTATYTATEAGTYTVDFTCTVFAGGNRSRLVILKCGKVPSSTAWTFRWLSTTTAQNGRRVRALTGTPAVVVPRLKKPLTPIPPPRITSAIPAAM